MRTAFFNKALFIVSFLISMLTRDTLSQNILRSEYFFDHDPGIGNATPLTISNPSNNVFITSVIPAISLRHGYHTLYVRTQTANNHWSLFEGQLFHVRENIIRGEYFFDHDPGVGNGTSISFPSIDNTVTINRVIPITGIRQGYHNLFVRTKTSIGSWSHFFNQLFYIEVDIVQAEYFIDTDPGVGNATPLPVTTPGNSTLLNNSINVGALPDGDHILVVRTKDRLGVWSHNEPMSFIVDTPLPVELVSFEAKTTDNQKVNLYWKTVTEKNNDHFTIERSSTGTEFAEISRIAGAGTSLTPISYTATDQNPLDGLNYYRLKQIDFDGTFTFSDVKVARVKRDAVPKIYPIPASSEWNIDLSQLSSDKNFQIRVDDMLGRKHYEQQHTGGNIIQFSKNDFANGSYIVTITSSQGKVQIQKISIH